MLTKCYIFVADMSLFTQDGRRVCGWTKNDIVLELGGILKAHQSQSNRDFKAPPSHALFSRIQFTRTGSAVRAQQIGEGDSAHLSQEVVQQGLFDDTETPAPAREETGGWLESDDIEDF
jgi:cell cycle checkpoint protein